MNTVISLIFNEHLWQITDEIVSQKGYCIAVNTWYIWCTHYKHRAATNIVTKLWKFRDLRTCQKGPKSDQRKTQIRPNTKPNVMTNHIMVIILMYITILDIKNVNIRT